MNLLSFDDLKETEKELELDEYISDEKLEEYKHKYKMS